MIRNHFVYNILFYGINSTIFLQFSTYYSCVACVDLNFKGLYQGLGDIQLVVWT